MSVPSRYQAPSIRSTSSSSSSLSLSTPLYSTKKKNVDHAFPPFLCSKKNIYELAGFDIHRDLRDNESEPHLKYQPRVNSPSQSSFVPAPNTRSFSNHRLNRDDTNYIMNTDNVSTKYTGAHPILTLNHHQTNNKLNHNNSRAPYTTGNRSPKPKFDLPKLPILHPTRTMVSDEADPVTPQKESFKFSTIDFEPLSPMCLESIIEPRLQQSSQLQSLTQYEENPGNYRPLSQASSVYTVISDRRQSLGDNETTDDTDTSSLASPDIKLLHGNADNINRIPSDHNYSLSLLSPVTRSNNITPLNDDNVDAGRPESTKLARGRSVLSGINETRLKNMGQADFAGLVANLSQSLENSTLINSENITTNEGEKSTTTTITTATTAMNTKTRPPPTDTESASSRICRTCELVISGKSVSARPALSGRFHPACFQCHRCQLSFRGVGTEIYVFEDTAYCGECYHFVNDSRCAACTRGIEGQCLETTADDKPTAQTINTLRYHPDCLQCGTCQLPITDTEYYVLDGRTYCDAHGPEMVTALEALEAMAAREEIELGKKASSSGGNKRLTVIEKRKTRLLYM